MTPANQDVINNSGEGLNWLGFVAQESSFAAFAAKVGGRDEAEEKLTRAIEDVGRFLALGPLNLDLDKARSQLRDIELALTSNDWRQLQKLAKNFLRTMQLPIPPPP